MKPSEKLNIENRNEDDVQLIRKKACFLTTKNNSTNNTNKDQTTVNMKRVCKYVPGSREIHGFGEDVIVDKPSVHREKAHEENNVTTAKHRVPDLTPSFPLEQGGFVTD